MVKMSKGVGAIGELRQIPGVGKQTEQDLIAIGYATIDSLRGADPEELYEQECIRQGAKVDRCVLYVYRCAVYYLSLIHISEPTRPY